MKTPAAGALLLAFLVGSALAVRQVAERAWTAFVAYETPFAAPNPGPRANPPHVDSAVVVLVDGLGLDASRGLAFLDELRAAGADLETRAGLPSLSLPGRGALLTGAWQDVHGQTTNFNPRPLATDHLFAAARRAGRTTALAAGWTPHRMLAPYVDRSLVYPRVASDEPGEMEVLETRLRWVTSAARGLLREPRPALTMIELTTVDQAGHRWGGASLEYRRAARSVDEAARAIASGLAGPRTVVAVVSDHGHLDRGGHGGDEDQVLRVPMVLAGGPVRPGYRGSAAHVDLAPTLAVLLGLEIPAANEGRPLLDALELDAAARASALRSLYVQRAGFASHALRWLSGRAEPQFDAAAPAPPADEATLRGRLSAIDAALEAARSERARAEAASRLRVLAAVVAGLVVVAVVLWAAPPLPRRELAAAAAAGLAAVFVYFALFPVAGLGYSLSLLQEEEELGPVFRADMVAALAAVGLSVAAAAVWAVRRRPMRRLELAWLAWTVAAVPAATLLLKMAVVYWRHGVFLSWRLPDPFWSFGFYLDALAVMAVGLAAPVLPLLAWAAARLARPPALGRRRAA